MEHFLWVDDCCRDVLVCEIQLILVWIGLVCIVCGGHLVRQLCKCRRWAAAAAASCAQACIVLGGFRSQFQQLLMLHLRLLGGVNKVPLVEHRVGSCGFAGASGAATHTQHNKQVQHYTCRLKTWQSRDWYKNTGPPPSLRPAPGPRLPKKACLRGRGGGQLLEHLAGQPGDLSMRVYCKLRIDLV